MAKKIVTVDEFFKHVDVRGWEKGSKRKEMMASYAYDVYRTILEERKLGTVAFFAGVLKNFAWMALYKACDEVDNGLEGVVVPELEEQRQADKKANAQRNLT